MSGGIIKDAGPYTFVKVRFDGEEHAYWYLSDLAVSEGDRVCAPFGKAEMPRIGVAEQVIVTSNGVTPIPLKTAKKLLSVCLSDDF